VSPRRRLSLLALAAAGLVAGALPAVAAEPLPHSLQIWDNAARAAIPTPLKIWLAFLALTFAASLFFVRRHPAARWAAGGFVLSHLVVAAIEFATDVRVGAVSLAHVICWTPALVMLARELPVTSTETRYGLWCRVLLGVIALAFVFDLRDAGMFLYYRITGHPGLA
jgi:hypothetical protein